MSNITRARKLPKVAPTEKPARKESEIGRASRLVGRFVVGQRRLFMMALLLLIVEAWSATRIPLVLSFLIDYLTPRIAQLNGQDVAQPLSPLQMLGLPTIFSPDTDTIAIVTIGIVLLTLFNSAADSLAEIYLAKGGRMLGLKMRVGLYSHLQKLSLAFYSKRRTGDLLTRVTGDVAAIEDFVIASLSDIVGSVLLIGFILYTMIVGAWQVAVMAALIIPVMALISNYFSQRIKTASKKQRAREGDLAASAQEMLTSIRVIQTYGSGGAEAKRFADLTRKTMDSALESARLQAWFSGTVSVLESVAVAAIIWLAVYLIFGSVGQPGAIGLGLLVAYTKYIQDMFKPTKKIIKEWNTFGKIYASVERIGELMDRNPTVQDEPGAIVAPPLKGQIEYRNVSFAYQLDAEDSGKEAAALRLALRDINLSIAPGEVLALVGGSGAGKSTIVQLLPRLYDPHSGHILIDGHDIREFTLDSLRGQMSLVLQESVLFTGTVADNIAYGRETATREEIIAAAMQANAHEFIEKLPEGYDTVLGERASTLSGGQRQRIAIARAFIRNSSILILDEPTTGLDAESTDLVLLALRSLMKGKATIIVSHDLNLIRHADKIVVIKQGEVAQTGTHKELLKSGGLYAELYHKQFGQAVEEQDGKVAMAASAAPLDDEEAEPVSPQAFHTLMTQALPKPVTPQMFETMLMQTQPKLAANAEAESPAMPAPVTPAPAALAPAAPAPPVAPEPVTLAATTPEATSPTDGTSSHRPKRAIFETTLLHTMPELADGRGANIDPTIRMDAAEVTGLRARLQGQDNAPPATHNGGIRAAQLDLLHSPVIQKELPGLQTAFDGEAMREYLQAALFGAARATYQIERCTPGKAIYSGAGCTLRYQIQAKASATGQSIQPLVVGRIFQNQFDCAIYMRDRLAPLAKLMHNREEVAPFVTPIAMIEPLNMVVHVFPIDGELPTLVGATDPQRMLELFAETLPDALASRFTPLSCRIVPVNYARRYRCVLRYELEGHGPDGQPARREVYGKVATDSHGAQVGKVITLLRQQIVKGSGKSSFHIPRSLGFRPDLQLALTEALPGTPRINQLLKARLSGAAETQEALTLEAAIDACAEIAAELHTSGIQLGHRRTFDDELRALQKEIHIVQRVMPELGERFQLWQERIETYAEESDPMQHCFSHGDYTYAQLIFAGAQRGLVDFDTVCQAEPALDLGQFLAYLRVATHKAQKNASANDTGLGAQVGERFFQTYVATAGDQIEDLDRLQVRASAYEVVSLMRMALHSWQQLKVARLENVIAVLEERLAALPQHDY